MTLFKNLVSADEISETDTWEIEDVILESLDVIAKWAVNEDFFEDILIKSASLT